MPTAAFMHKISHALNFFLFSDTPLSITRSASTQSSLYSYRSHSISIPDLPVPSVDLSNIPDDGTLGESVTHTIITL